MPDGRDILEAIDAAARAKRFRAIVETPGLLGEGIGDFDRLFPTLPSAGPAYQEEPTGVESHPQAQRDPTSTAPNNVVTLLHDYTSTSVDEVHGESSSVPALERSEAAGLYGGIGLQSSRAAHFGRAVSADIGVAQTELGEDLLPVSLNGGVLALSGFDDCVRSWGHHAKSLDHTFVLMLTQAAQRALNASQSRRYAFVSWAFVDGPVHWGRSDWDHLLWHPSENWARHLWSYSRSLVDGLIVGCNVIWSSDHNEPDQVMVALLCASPIAGDPVKYGALDSPWKNLKDGVGVEMHMGDAARSNIYSGQVVPLVHNGAAYRRNAELWPMGEFVRRRREELGLTQSEVAAAAGVRSVKTVRNLETGRNRPNDLTLRGIETALRLEMYSLVRFNKSAAAEVDDWSASGPRDSVPLPQELLDLSSAIRRLSAVREAMVLRGFVGAESIVDVLDETRTRLSALSKFLETYSEGAGTGAKYNFEDDRFEIVGTVRRPR